MNQIKKIREIQGLKRAAIASNIGMSEVMLGLIERGKRNLNEKWIGKISKELKCTKAQLLGEQSINHLEENQTEKQYIFKEKYLEDSIEIINQITDSEDLTKKGRAKLLSKVYELVHDFHELGCGKKEFIHFIKNELEKNNDTEQQKRRP